MSFDRPDLRGLASLLLVIWKNELGLTYFEDYPEEVRKVTPLSALSAGQQLLRNKPFVTVIVGPQKSLEKAGVKGLPAPSL
ncbi:MAG: hypothetical protein M0T83_07920 [Nitrospiraceae bacterium]|nr:hypothetical protein [Nitrospiraceae bacterium]